MFPYLLIATGLVVLVVGSRLTIAGAAVGAILGLALLRLLPGNQGFWLALLITLGFAALSFFGASRARGALGRLTLILGAVAGAAITLNVLDLFRLSFGLLDWILAVAGACIGAVLVISFKDWAVIILAGLAGSMLTMRGIGMLLPWLDGLLATSLALVLAAAGIAYQAGLFTRRKPLPR
ncbi:MAG: hypothetical protein RMK84_00540 [Oscillochloridaceae bacterium]|nr:hypothetical protein [Chloroflexaceae bacterium]MDW8388583.1 hypothetical protein [Oscillochloridaceae bacterium]